MATIRRVEDIKAWQIGRKLVNLSYRVTKARCFDSDHAFRSQIRRASLSITANIAEGFGRSGNREFHQFLAQARGSVAELHSHLTLALDLGFVSPDEYEQAKDLCRQASAAINGLMRYLQRTPIRGEKYRSNMAPSTPKSRPRSDKSNS